MAEPQSPITTGARGINNMETKIVIFERREGVKIEIRHMKNLLGMRTHVTKH